MKREFYLSDKAEQDLFTHARYIAQDDRDVAEKFISSFIETAKMIVDMSSIGKRYSDIDLRIDGIRVFPTRDFNRYLIFYHQVQKGKYIEIIRVIHSAQDTSSLFGE